METSTATMTFDTALGVALRECKDPYAQTYLRELNTARQLYGERGVKTQILYALNNMATWKGDNAREVKKVFKAFAK